MQKELDKVERFANKVEQQSKLPPAAAKKLLKDVKVNLTFSFHFIKHSQWPRNGIQMKACSYDTFISLLFRNLQHFIGVNFQI